MMMIFCIFITGHLSIYKKKVQEKSKDTRRICDFSKKVDNFGDEDEYDDHNDSNLMNDYVNVEDIDDADEMMICDF